MGIHKAKQRRWALGLPLLAHGELFEHRGPQAGGVLGRETEQDQRVGKPTVVLSWAHPLPGQCPVFRSLFCLFLHRAPLHICIPLKNGFILSALCHPSDFSFNIS